MTRPSVVVAGRPAERAAAESARPVDAAAGPPLPATNSGALPGRPGPLEESQALLVRRWGEMGGYWGINRTMAEIHALMFVSTRPLCTDDVMDQLKISRGNASMNLRGLVDWGLIERVHKFGDRKEYFQAKANVWHMFETIMRERRRREVEPIMATIARCRLLVSDPTRLGDPATTEKVQEYRRRLDELRDFLETMGRLFELVLHFGSEGIARIVRQLASPPAPAPLPLAGAAPARQTRAAGPSARPARRLPRGKITVARRKAR